ncbi:DNA primase [Streptomyces sp. AC555_RSS877]|uniref:DNA primase n=1 Tax=Streptomyces sp. AC555_RSS877 TaxID=2823688 RepID=UPI001C2693DC|nr:DNA primase [Streptomyces sp. AC555_RSS877]
MNRVGLGLAVGAGYVLGRTKKAKMAFAVGTLVAGKRMHLNPKALADLASQQLKNNPQFKEIGDQLREDLRGVGKAASGAMVERQIDSIADRLHGRTSQVRDQLAGVVPDPSDLGSQGDSQDEEPEDEYEEPEDDETEEADEEPEAEAADDSEEADDSDEESEPRRRPAAKKAAKKAPAKKAPAKKAAEKAPAKKAPAKKTGAKKTAATRDAARGARTRVPKGGAER